MDLDGTGLIIPSNQHLFNLFNGALNVQKTHRHFVEWLCQVFIFLSYLSVSLKLTFVLMVPLDLYTDYSRHSLIPQVEKDTRTLFYFEWITIPILMTYLPRPLLLPNKQQCDSIWSSFHTSSYFISWKGPSQDSLNLFTNHVDDKTW